MYSIFHFWHSLLERKTKFVRLASLDKFPFRRDMFSCSNKGVFPDFAIKLNKTGSRFTGGELIELKDSKAYIVSSFNSTIPTGKKKISHIISSEKSAIFRQMREAGDDVFSLEERDVYYLVRGRRKGHQKICLVHGSFFETIPAKDLVGEAFSRMINEQLSDTKITNEIKDMLKGIFSRQEMFSSVHNVDNASVNVRFRVMTEVNQEGNILNPSQYPEILDDTLNLVCPFHSETEKEDLIEKMDAVVGAQRLGELKILQIKHPFNGWFLVFQAGL